MTEPHIDDIQLRKKIIDLFEYRLFPRLIEDGTNDKDSSEFYERLIQLQSAIYHLDAHLEANWHTDFTKLAWHWDRIKDKLEDFGIDDTNSGQYLRHIYKYEKHELELRTGKSPLRFDPQYFYFYKSCDVKLLRRLIYEHYKLSPSCGKLADWRYYDLVTEVNDDIEDVFEDLDYINGNRFLLTILREGREETQYIFQSFLKIIADKAKEKYTTANGKYNAIIFEMTMQRIAETQKLLRHRIKNVSVAALSNANLAHHLRIKV
jgi:hypothetical protein